MAEASASKPEAKKGDEDLSMEEILQSIRRIIAEDDPEKKGEAKNGKAKPEAKKNDEVPGSDVLELTEMIKEDGTTETLKPAAPAATPAIAAPAAKPAETPKPAEPPKPATPAAAAPAKPPEAPKPAAPAAKEPPPGDVLGAIDQALKPSEIPAAVAGEGLLAPEAAAAASASLKKLNVPEPEKPAPLVTPAPGFRNGDTVESIVAEMLRPMMKSWLDANLPKIVEHIVEREVKKLTK